MSIKLSEYVQVNIEILDSWHCGTDCQFFNSEWYFCKLFDSELTRPFMEFLNDSWARQRCKACKKAFNEVELKMERVLKIEMTTKDYDYKKNDGYEEYYFPERVLAFEKFEKFCENISKKVKDGEKTYVQTSNVIILRFLTLYAFKEKFELIYLLDGVVKENVDELYKPYANLFQQLENLEWELTE